MLSLPVLWGGDPGGLCPRGGLPGSSPLIPTAAPGPTLRARRAAPRGLGPACSRSHHPCGRQSLARSGRSVSVRCMTSLRLQHPAARGKPPWNPGPVALALTPHLPLSMRCRPTIWYSLMLLESPASLILPKGLGRVPVVIPSGRQGARLWRCGPACTTQAGSGGRTWHSPHSARGQHSPAPR